MQNFYVVCIQTPANHLLKIDKKGFVTVEQAKKHCLETISVNPEDYDVSVLDYGVVFTSKIDTAYNIYADINKIEVE